MGIGGVSTCNDLSKCSVHTLTASTGGRVIVHPIGVELQRYYKKNVVIGSGGYSEVWSCVEKASGQMRACKDTDKGKVPEWSSANAEADLLIMLQVSGANNNGIVRLFEVFEEPCSMHFILELCIGGDLLSRENEHGHFAEAQAKTLMLQMATALEHIHSYRIVHRDLKLENWLLLHRRPSLDLRLCDFGLSTIVKQNEILTQRVGSPYYAAPELLKGSYGIQVDLWSLGVCLYMILSNTAPFNGMKDRQIFASVEVGEISFDQMVWADVSTAARNLVSQLLDRNPLARPPARRILASDWIAR